MFRGEYFVGRTTDCRSSKMPTVGFRESNGRSGYETAPKEHPGERCDEKSRRFCSEKKKKIRRRRRNKYTYARGRNTVKYRTPVVAEFQPIKPIPFAYYYGRYRCRHDNSNSREHREYAVRLLCNNDKRTYRFWYVGIREIGTAAAAAGHVLRRTATGRNNKCHPRRSSSSKSRRSTPSAWTILQIEISERASYEKE